MQVEATVPAQIRRGPAHVVLGNAAGWFGVESDQVIRLDTTTCLSADDLVALLFGLNAGGCSTADVLELTPDQVRSLVGYAVAVSGLEAVGREVERARAGWDGMPPIERTHWVVCAGRVWEAFGLPGAAPVQPVDLPAGAAYGDAYDAEASFGAAQFMVAA